MTLEVLQQEFTVCKVAEASAIPLTLPYCFVGKTDQELSLVCPTEHTPDTTIAREDGWRAFRVVGSMEFGLVGVLARLTGCLAAQGIPVFAVSTFDTDYMLVKAERLETALSALVADGYTIER